MGIQKQKSCFSCCSPHTIGILNALGAEQEREITEIAQTDFLAFEELLSHAIYGDVEDGRDVCARIDAAVAGDVLGKLLDGHHIRILRYGEGILLLGLHQVEVGLVGVLTLSFCLVDT